MGTIYFNKLDNHKGRLGSRMFQVAATIGIALRNNMDYLFPPCEYYHFFSGKIPVAEKLFARPAIPYTENVLFKYEPIKLEPHHNYDLTGYFQSEKYWKHCEALIRKTFVFKREGIVRSNFKKLVDYKKKQNPHKDVVTVSIHVRRGDYLELPHHHPILSSTYYSIAIDKMRTLFPDKCLYFIIFTDDKEWCIDNFRGLKDSIVMNIDFAQDDMCMMSLCDHNIIANSSFSWWGSYLNANPNKIVIAPAMDKWFGRGYAHFNLDDLYLSSWVLI